MIFAITPDNNYLNKDKSSIEYIKLVVKLDVNLLTNLKWGGNFG